MTPQETASILSQPISINRYRIANRLVMGPMAANSPTPEGRPGDETIAFFERRARGGVGMIIIGGMAATRRGATESPSNGLRLDIDEFIPDYRRLGDAVHAHGVPIIAEIVPSLGRMARKGPLISASPMNVVVSEDQLPEGVKLPGGFSTQTPAEATIAQIEELEADMIDAAVRAEAAGLDGVEVAAHMSYFAASFLSSRTNWRTDRYGGSVTNRARMLVNIVRGVRDRLRPDFIVGLRITSNDYMPGGQGARGFAEVAKEVEAAGIDYVALSPGCYEVMRKGLSQGVLIDSGDGRIFKDMLNVPVLLQGVHDPARAAEAISAGHGDMLMIARPILADPDYARKVLAGRPQELVVCNRDNLCMRRLMLNMPIRCSVNPRMGRDSRRSALPPADRVLKAPIERLVLGLTGSDAVMNVVGKLMKKKTPVTTKEATPDPLNP